MTSRAIWRVIEDQQRQILDLVHPLVKGFDQVALLDFPNHNNVGDNAIWLGERELLRRLMLPATYMCDIETYSEEALRAAIPEGGLILLHGGGNFGDVWPAHQRFRERIVQSFPNHKIIQLPQSVHFSTEEGIHATAEVLRQHPDLTILVRDRNSLELLTETMGLKAELCPDAAFMIGPQFESFEPVRDVVWIARDDHESAGRPEIRDLDAEVVDWLVGETGKPMSFVMARGTVRVRTTMHKVMRMSPVIREQFGGAVAETFDALAQARFERGLRILSRGRVIVTDRLHGHILATLLGKPQVLLDNHYGKIARYHAAFTHHAVDIVSADGWEDAADKARALLS